jgi:hypothetical protein
MNKETKMAYQKIREGDPGWELVSGCKKRGLWVCDAITHNSPDGCSNPDCFKFMGGRAARRSGNRPRIASYIVSVVLPEGVNAKMMREYIQSAVASWRGGLDPEDPLFELDGRLASVRNWPSVTGR